MKQSDQRSIRMPELEHTVGFKKSTIYSWMNPKHSRYDASFPKGSTRGRARFWWLPDVLAWLNGTLVVIGGNADLGEQAHGESIGEAALTDAPQPTAHVDDSQDDLALELSEWRFPKNVTPELAIEAETLIRERASFGQLTSLGHAMEAAGLLIYVPAHKAMMEKVLEDISRSSYRKHGVLLGLMVTVELSSSFQPTLGQARLATELGIDVSSQELLREHMKSIVEQFEDNNQPHFLFGVGWEWRVGYGRGRDWSLPQLSRRLAW